MFEKKPLDKAVQGFTFYFIYFYFHITCRFTFVYCFSNLPLPDLPPLRACPFLSIVGG